MNDLVVVGSGLTGLFAAAIAARRGARVTLISAGRGGLAISHGCIDTSAGDPLPAAFRTLPRDHPYSLAGMAALHAGLVALQELAHEAGSAYVGGLAEGLRLPTALGSLHSTTLAPESMAAGDVRQGRPFALAGFPGYRDFYPALASDLLARQGCSVTAVLELPLLDAPRHRDAYAPDLARLFDDPRRLEEIARAWKPRLAGIASLGLPAVLGYERSREVFDRLQERLGSRFFEIPTLAPSVTGLRLERLLRRAGLSAGVQFIEGAPAVGQVDGRSGGRRVSGVVARTAGGPRVYPAGSVLLATGGLLHGGLIARPDGRIQESVFDLPVEGGADRSRWTSASPFASQPYARFGIRVDAEMRPLGRGAAPIFENLHAAGGVLAGADRSLEGSRQGIDLATAQRAVEAILG